MKLFVSSCIKKRFMLCLKFRLYFQSKYEEFGGLSPLHQYVPSGKFEILCLIMVFISPTELHNVLPRVAKFTTLEKYTSMAFNALSHDEIMEPYVQIFERAVGPNFILMNPYGPRRT